VRRTLTFLAYLLGVAVSCQPLASQTPPTARVTLFEGARLIVGDGSVIENSAFVVNDNKFTQVGRRGDIATPAGATRVDLRGKTVIPAMLDIHTHIGFLNDIDGSILKANFNRENLIDHLNRYAYHGFAAAQSLGTDMGELPYQLRDEVIPGAALFRTVGRGLAWPGSGGGGGNQEKERSDVPYSVTTVAEARAAVRDLAPHHPNFVKIWVDDRNHTVKKLTPELYGAAIDEAHKLGFRVIAHVYDLEDAKGLVRAGVEGFAHMVRDKDLDDEFMTLLKEHPNVWFGPNIGIYGRFAYPTRPAWLDDPVLHETIRPSQIQALERQYTNMSPARVKNATDQWNLQVRTLTRLRSIHTTIVFGSDSAGDPSRPMGWHAAYELETMVRAGMTPMEVIVSATKTAADLMLLDHLGTVAPTKSADFVVLNANPLDDITNTRKINKVYLRGTEVDRAALAAKWKAQWSSLPAAK
jgi:imidazolonepropionase-like amidohydrolase